MNDLLSRCCSVVNNRFPRFIDCSKQVTNDKHQRKLRFLSFLNPSFIIRDETHKNSNKLLLKIYASGKNATIAINLKIKRQQKKGNIVIFQAKWDPELENKSCKKL